MFYHNIYKHIILTQTLSQVNMESEYDLLTKISYMHSDRVWPNYKAQESSTILMSPNIKLGLQN